MMLGEIDLDPASSVAANKQVKAKYFYGYSKKEFVDGMFMPWRGRVWMNHPFGRAEAACSENCQKHLENPSHRHHTIPWHGNSAWVTKLIDECREGVTEALCITYACTSEAWFQPLIAHPQCFLTPRTNYFLPDGKIKKGVTKGSVVTYLGKDVKSFHKAFRQFGEIKVRFQ